MVGSSHRQKSCSPSESPRMFWTYSIRSYHECSEHITVSDHIMNTLMGLGSNRYDPAHGQLFVLDHSAIEVVYYQFISQPVSDSHNNKDTLEKISWDIQKILFFYLKVWGRDALCELFKQWTHHLLKLSRLNHVQYLLQLIQEHHLNIHTKLDVRT